MFVRSILTALLVLSLMTSAWPQSNETKQPFLIVDTAKIEPSSYVDQSLKFIVTAPETSGTMTVFESTEHPGYKTQWHRHNNAEETFYILEGVLTVKAAGKTHHARAGSFVYIPRGTPHGQGNFSDKPVRFITTVTPAGIELFFRDRDEILKTTKPADPAFASRLQAVREKHKHWLEVLGPWEPDSKP